LIKQTAVGLSGSGLLLPVFHGAVAGAVEGGEKQ
jgi:hypothetical protein